jgi:hypothetical protein
MACEFLMSLLTLPSLRYGCAGPRRLDHLSDLANKLAKCYCSDALMHPLSGCTAPAI